MLLEREPRPSLVLNREGKIVSANRLLSTLLEAGTPTHLVHFADEWLRPKSRAAFDEAWQTALSGRKVARLGLAVRTTACHFELVFDLLPLITGDRVDWVMLVLVETIDRRSALPLTPPKGTIYEVSFSDSSRRLTRAVTAGKPIAFEAGQRCFGVLHGRSTPCDWCPMQENSGEGTSIRFTPGEPFIAELLQARRVDDVATVSVTPIDEQTYSQLFQARVDALAWKAKLTTREQQVFRLLLMGRSLEDVASVQGVSARTAKYHQQNLLRKLGAESRADLVRLLA